MKNLFVCLGTLISSLMALWIPFDGTSDPTPPSIAILSNTTRQLILNIKIHGMFLQDTTIGGKTYQRILIPQEITTSDIGKAELPVLKRLIQIQPQSGTILSVIQVEESLFTNCNIFPTQIPMSDSGPQPLFTIDTVFYNTDLWYPSDIATVGTPGILKDLRVITISIHPISFNPSQQKILVRREITLKISFSGYDPRNTIPSQPRIYDRSLDLMYDFMILNYEPQVDTIIQESERDQWGVNYVIVTADQFYNTLQPFVFWKNKKGAQVFVHKLSEVPGYSSAPGDTDEIKYFLRDVVSNIPNFWPSYVILVGNYTDLDSGDYTIPMFTEWSHPVGGIAYSDHYYACLFGNDEFDDVVVARWCVTDFRQINTIIDKTFAYERTSVTYWGKERVLLIAAHDPSHCYKENKEAVRSYLGGTQTPYEELYENLAVPSNIAPAINGLGFGLVNYRGHGLWHGWYHTGGATVFEQSHVYSLINTNEYPIVLNICCSCGAIEADEEVMAEAWVNTQNKGGVGSLAATRPSFTESNNKFDIDLFHYLYNHPPQDAHNYTVGRGVMSARNLLVAAGGTYNLANARTYLYLGDPDLSIWTNDWGNLSVIHPTFIMVCRPTTLQIYVQRWYGQNWGPVREAKVCVWKPNEGFYRRVLTNNLGIAAIDITPRRIGNVYITVTYANCRPYEGVCRAGFHTPMIAQSVIPAATGYNNSRRLIRDAQGRLHLAFTSGDSVYHTFLQDTSWAEPVGIGEGKYPALAIDNNGRIHCVWSYNQGMPYFLEELRYSNFDGNQWSSPIPLMHTYNSFFWGIGAPSLAIKDSFAYITFKSYFGPTYHPEPGGPAPQVIVLESRNLIFGKFNINNPLAFIHQSIDAISITPTPYDPYVYQNSLVPLLISPSITVDLAGIPHILWEGDSTNMRYYTIVDTNITTQIFDENVDFPFIGMNGDQIQVFYTARDSIRYRYSWTGTTNLSQTWSLTTGDPETSSGQVSSGQYLTWTKREDGISHLYYGAIPASGTINPIEINYSTDLISYPQILFNPKFPSIDLVWTEYSEIDSTGLIYYLNLPLTEVAPIYAFDMGTETPVPILAQRDGYKVLGTEDYKTFDYDSTELVYHLTLHSPHTKYKIRWTWYHEEKNKIKLQFNIDDIFHRNRWVNPKEKVIEEDWIPDACIHDNEITIKVKLLNGTIAVLSGFEIYTEEVGGGAQGGEAQLTSPFYFDRIYPNPTKGMIKIRFNSPDERKITIKLYDVCGRLVHKDLIKSRLGMNEVLIRPEGLSAGIYFVRLEVENYGQMAKIILFK
ncbi:MAG: C25 family cysteine peptidase [candidate division WOR-3 bacterium]